MDTSRSTVGVRAGRVDGEKIGVRAGRVDGEKIGVRVGRVGGGKIGVRVGRVGGGKIGVGRNGSARSRSADSVGVIEWRRG